MIISDMAGVKRPLGIYLHIPFCRQKCLYCDFLSAPAAEATMIQYVDALCSQIGREAEEYRDFYVRTVFFGGGTPSLLPPEQIGRIMRQLRTHFAVSQDAEITMESNPGTLDYHRLAGYRQEGINRLSMGLQSAQDEELRALGRIHDYRTFLQNYEAARAAGFDNINVDLMSALPGQTVEGWIDTLRKAAELAPEHISAYSLIVEEGTPFYERYGGEEETGSRAGRREECADGDRGKERDEIWPPLPSEEEERLMYERTGQILKEYGYHRYEISNYARPGRECLHNVGYWKRTDYVGFGLGSASLVNDMRWKMTDRLSEYLQLFSGENERDGKEEIRHLSQKERMEEFMFLGLRLSEGISLRDFREQFETGLFEVYGTVLPKLEEEGLILFYSEGKKVRLTSRGVDLSNYVLAQFLLEE